MVIILMGVSGSGKTTVGERLAAQLGCVFHDADNDHPTANVEKMRRGEALTESDREPWFRILNDRVRGWIADHKDAVLACSALTETARRAITAGAAADQVTFVHLTGSTELIRDRLRDRRHRYMPASLLDSQVATLQPPIDALNVDIDATPDEIVHTIRKSLGR